MLQNAHLDAIIARETYAEILAALSPKQLAVIALRLDDISFLEAERYLGISKGCSYERMKTVRRNLPQRFPHLSTMLEGDS